MNHRICVGDQIILASDCHQYHDAINGPLKPGDVGLMTSSNVHNGVFVIVSGSSWYYDKRALRRAPDNGGPTPSTTSMQGAAFYNAGAVVANLHPNPVTNAVAPPPPVLGAHAAASPGAAGGFSFGAGTALRKPKDPEVPFIFLRQSVSIQ